MHNSGNLRVTVVSVGQVKVSEKGTYYFQAFFKLGRFGRPVTRTFVGYLDEEQEDGVRWDRCSPKEMQKLVGEDVAGEVYIEPAEVEPYPVTYSDTGRTDFFSTRTLVRFCDESQEHAIRRMGLIPKTDRRTGDLYVGAARLSDGHQPPNYFGENLASN